MERFSLGTTLYSGPDALQQLRALCPGRTLLVTDRYFVQCGLAARIAALCGGPTEIFDRVAPEPTVALVAQGAAHLARLRPQALLALGGGSVMDCAKEMLSAVQGGARLIAIPTTSGSGSEVTDFAVLTHEQAKYPLMDPALRPDVAILDSDLLQQLPKGLIAETGFDVLSHALESYVAKNAGTISDLLAKEAFSSAFAALPASYAGNREVRLKIHKASTMAGLSFTNAGLGLCHAISHALGGLYHVPHGRLNGVLLPAVIDCNAHVCGKKYAELARAAGLGGSADTIALRNLKNGLIRLRRELELPENLMQAGIDPRNLWRNTEAIVSTAMADPCCKTNPMEAEPFLIRRILDEVAGHV